MQTSDSADSAKLKKIIIAMGVVIFILLIAVVILLFRLKDSYEDWEDEEDTYEADDEEEPEPVRVSSSTRATVAVEEPDEDIKIVTKKNKPKKASAITKPSKALQADRKEAWQSKNFLDIDDDMEFEFLDIDK
jgi:flagellar basal body-associated protein FliL